MLTFLVSAACSSQDPLLPGSPPPPPLPPPPLPPPPAACVTPSGVLPSAAGAVVINPLVRHQTIAGFGSTLRLFDDPHVTETFDPVTQRGAVMVPASEQARVLAALYTDLRLTRVRYASEIGLEPVNDNSDPGNTDLSMFDFRWKRLDGHVDLVAASRPLGLRTWFGSPGAIEPWMDRTDPAEFVEWTMAMIRRWRDRGQTLPYWSLINEPGYLGNLTGPFLRDAIKVLGPRLVAEGIPTRLVVPDDINPQAALLRTQVILADPLARQYVGAIAFHLYDGPSDPDLGSSALMSLAALGRQYSIPLWMTEWSTPDWMTWARVMHAMLAVHDVAAVDYMWGFFGQWEGPSTHLITIKYNGTNYEGFELRKQYYAMRQWSRYVAPGAVRVDATSNVPSILPTAFISGDSVVVVLVNTGATDGGVQLSLGAGSPCVRTVAIEHTSELRSASATPIAPLLGRGVTTLLPARSITTFVFTP